MPGFLKIFFGSFLGAFFGLVLFFGFAFLVTIGLGVSIFQAAEQNQRAKAPAMGSVLELDLNFDLKQYLDQDPLSRIDFDTFEMKKALGLDSLLLTLDEAARDSRIQGMHLKVDAYLSDWSTTWEIRQALTKFKEAGKWIVCFSHQFDQKQYYLASVADEVFLHPHGEMSLTGIQLESVFFGPLFQKLGIDLQAIRGKNNIYKSAIEPFTLEAFSAENKEQLQVIVDQYWDVLSSDILESRGMESAVLESMVETLGPRDANAALSANLVDDLIEEKDLEKIIDEDLSADYNEPDRVTVFEYSKHVKLHPFIQSDEFAPSLALIHADGPIQNGPVEDRVIQASRINKWIEEAVEDPNVEGIVIRVNSPGGGAFASELIYAEIEKASQVKPITASFASSAASGGYYLACGANTIVSSPLTMTGSIGVFGMIPSFEKFLKDNLHISHDGVKTHASADAMNGLRALNAREMKVVQAKVDDIYSLFKSRVEAGRSMDAEEVETLARGRVWMGLDAQKHQLVDHVDGLLGTIEAMEKELGFDIDSRNIKVWPKNLMWKDWVKELDFEQALFKASGFRDIPYAEELTRLKSIREQERIQARLPFEFSVD